MRKTPALFVFLLFALCGVVCASGQPSNVQQDGDLLILASDNDWGDEEWDDEGEEDAFGGVMHADFIDIENGLGEFIKTPQGTALKFSLTVIFSEKPDEENEVEEAWVYFIEGSGEPWNRIALKWDVSKEIGSPYDKRGNEIHITIDRNDEKKNQQNWSAEVKPDEFGLTPDSKIVFFFRVRDKFGNIVTELPETDPGWPPNPNAFFPGAVDMNNSEEIVPADHDILDTFIARDHNYLYLISRYDGVVSPGTYDPPSMNGYITKFTNPAVQKEEGLMVGTMQAFVPLIAYPHDLIDITRTMKTGEYKNYMTDGSILSDTTREYSVGIGGNTLYTRTSFKAICPSRCESLRIIFFTLANNSLDALMPIPYNTSPFTVIYFRTHTISSNDDIPVVSGNSSNESLTPPKYLFPDKIKEYLSDAEMADRKHKFESFTGEPAKISRNSILAPVQGTKIYRGPDPIRIEPGDVIFYQNYKFEVYTRNFRIKVRLFYKDKWWHTIMIGKDTKPRRDEQHNDGYIYITLSNFNENPLSCDFSIKDSDKN